jgi:hypothetical protein
MANSYIIQSMYVSGLQLVIVGMVNGNGPYTVTLLMAQVQSEPNVTGIETLIGAALLAAYNVAQSNAATIATIPSMFSV